MNYHKLSFTLVFLLFPSIFCFSDDANKYELIRIKQIVKEDSFRDALGIKEYTYEIEANSSIVGQETIYGRTIIVKDGQKKPGPLIQSWLEIYKDGILKEKVHLFNVTFFRSPFSTIRLFEIDLEKVRITSQPVLSIRFIGLCGGTRRFVDIPKTLYPGENIDSQTIYPCGESKVLHNGVRVLLWETSETHEDIEKGQSNTIDTSIKNGYRVLLWKLDVEDEDEVLHETTDVSKDSESFPDETGEEYKVTPITIESVIARTTMDNLTAEAEQMVSSIMKQVAENSHLIHGFMPWNEGFNNRDKLFKDPSKVEVFEIPPITSIAGHENMIEISGPIYYIEDATVEENGDITCKIKKMKEGFIFKALPRISEEEPDLISVDYEFELNTLRKRVVPLSIPVISGSNQFEGLWLPMMDTRSMRSSVKLKDGDTIIIGSFIEGGIISNKTQGIVIPESPKDGKSAEEQKIELTFLTAKKEKDEEVTGPSRRTEPVILKEPEMKK